MRNDARFYSAVALCCFLGSMIVIGVQTQNENNASINLGPNWFLREMVAVMATIGFLATIGALYAHYREARNAQVHPTIFSPPASFDQYLLDVSSGEDAPRQAPPLGGQRLS